MASRLSSLLVRDGVVGVKRMQRAFQRQVLYGGALDTVLLEMNLVPVERLHQYLSLATGLPPANHAEIDDVEAAVIERCPRELAIEHRVVPVSFDGDALRVLVCDPVDLGRLEALANELSCPVQPLVVPEYQFRVSFARVYGDAADDRYAKLAETAGSAPPDAPVGRAPSVIIADEASQPHEAVEIEPEVTTAHSPPEERLRGKRPKPEQPERRVTQELSTDALREHVAATEALAASAPQVAAPAAAPPEPVAAPEPAAPAAVVHETTPLSAADARALLSTVTERSLVFETFLRALRYRTAWAGLFTVQRGQVTGRVALADDFDREAIGTVTFPVDAARPFAQVASSQSFYIGDATTGDAAVDEALTRLGEGTVPATLLLLPLVLRDRVVAIAAAHRADEPFSVADVSELLPLATATADSLVRVLAGAKSSAAAADASGKTNGVRKTTEGPAPAPVPVEPARTSPSGATSDAVAKILRDCESTDPAEREAAIKEALERAPEIMPGLYDHFPGKLEIDRKEGGDRPMRAAQHGPILDLVSRMGPAAGELLAEKMRDNDREMRYYATLAASELRPKNALNELVERLFDGDREIRALAVDGLTGYPAEDLEEALDFARRALHSEDLGRLKAATDALAKLGDVSSIPDLLDAHSRGGDAAEAARKALLVMTKQDCGSSNRKWRAWWSKNADKSRVEWMLEGLGHKSAEVRKSAAEDLRAVTGEYFGYHHDLPKKEREQARQRWLQWWAESGRQRFLRGDERERPTGVLPQQRR